MPGFVRQLRFLERLFPPQRVQGVQPSNVTNEVQLTHEVLKTGIITGFIMRSSFLSTVAAGGLELFPMGLEPNSGNFSIPVWSSINGTNGAALFGQLEFGDTLNAPDPWGRWGFELLAGPPIFSTIVLKANVRCLVMLPVIPRGLDVNLSASPALGVVIERFSLFLEGPAELISPEFFNSKVPNFVFSNAF